MLGQNLIVVAARGLRFDVVGEEGWSRLTPMLQWLARRGALLRAGSACPADEGGLVSLLTGLHARQHGYLEPTNGPIRCQGWPHWLRAGGYYVAGVGCVGLVQAELDRCVLVQPVSCVDPSGCAYGQAVAPKGLWEGIAQQRRARQRQGPLDVPRLEIDAEDDIDGFIAARAVAMVGQMPTDRPWALLVVFSGPGNDLPPPRPYDQVVPAADLDDGFVPADLRSLDVVAQLDYPRAVIQRLDAQTVARLRSDYLGRAALVDHGIGAFVRAARRRPDAPRTWVVASADHGKLLGESGLLGHRSFLFPAIDVPVVVASLGAPKPDPPDRRRCDVFASTVDVVATIAALAGCDLPKACVGRSLLPAAQGQALSTLASEVGCLSEFGRRLMLQTDRYKIVLDVDTRQVTGVYDLLNDPQEKRNLTESVLGCNLMDALRWRVADALLALRAPDPSLDNGPPA